MVINLAQLEINTYMKVVYIAGPYRGDIETNIANARRVAIAVWEAGHVALCPHLNSARFELDCRCLDESYLEGDLLLLARCDFALFLWNWTKSSGAKAEHSFCLQQNIPYMIVREEDNKFDIARLIS
jgi:hypothetical protein